MPAERVRAGEIAGPDVLDADRLRVEVDGQRQVPASWFPVRQGTPVPLEELPFHVRRRPVHPGKMKLRLAPSGDDPRSPGQLAQIVLAGEPQLQPGRLDEQAEHRPHIS